MHKRYFNKFKVPDACSQLQARYDSHVHRRERCAHVTHRGHQFKPWWHSQQTPSDRDAGKENRKEGTFQRNHEPQFVRVLRWFVSSQAFFLFPLRFSYNSCGLCGTQGKDEPMQLFPNQQFILLWRFECLHGVFWFWPVSDIHCCLRHTQCITAVPAHTWRNKGMEVHMCVSYNIISKFTLLHWN